MIPSPSAPHVTTMLDVEPEGSASVTCPLCQRTHPSLTHEALEAGASWLCARCGQRWNAPRLRAVNGYAAWVARHG
jgi:ribosomal protein L37AE/L43A